MQTVVYHGNINVEFDTLPEPISHVLPLHDSAFGYDVYDIKNDCRRRTTLESFCKSEDQTIFQNN